MTAINPKPHRPPASPLARYLVVILLSLVIGVVLQEVPWRGVLPGLLPIALKNSQQQMKFAEQAFKSGDDTDALPLFQKLAAAGNPKAEYWLAVMKEDGLGVAEDPAGAVALYGKAAAKDILSAQMRLGEIYLNGNLTTPDYAKAFELLKQAAMAGQPRAAMLLGQMYRTGTGVSVDLVEAYAWSEVAVLEGLAFAKAERDASLSGLSEADKSLAAAHAAAYLETIKKKEVATPPTSAQSPAKP